MGLLGPLRETLSAYRKRKQHSIDGAVAGVGYNQYQRGYNRTAFDRSLAVGPARTAQMYDPDPGSAEFPEPEYQPYEWEMSPHPTPPLRASLPELPEPEDASPPDYDACPMTDGLLARGLHEANERPDAQEFLPFDYDVRAQDIMHGSGSLEEMVSEPGPSGPLQEIEMAISQQLTPDLGHYVLHDDYLRQSQDEMNQLLDSMWNAQPPATQPDLLGEGATALDDQMQVMSAQSSMPEPQPVEEDPWEMQRRMYDEQLQAMMSPFGMMMGPGPMM